MTLQQPVFPPPHNGAELTQDSLNLETATSVAKQKDRTGESRKGKRRQRKKSAKRIPGLYYPTNITPEEFFKQLGKLKEDAELEVERLITFLDQADGYSYDEREEEPDGDNSDDEPSIGAAENEVTSSGVTRPIMDQVLAWIERSDEVDECEDCEPILGAAEASSPSNPWFSQINAWKETGGECCELDAREGCELDEEECCDLELRGESDSDESGSVDDEPSLGSLDSRMNQTKWAQHDYFPQGLWVGMDCEDDGLVRGEDDGLIHGEGSGDDNEGCEAEDEVQGLMGGGDRNGDIV